jgi:predicted TIM-barrel fold metal-dependent hydrolase
VVAPFLLKSTPRLHPSVDAVSFVHEEDAEVTYLLKVFFRDPHLSIEFEASTSRLRIQMDPGREATADTLNCSNMEHKNCMHSSEKRHIVDAHVHLYDGGENRYEHLEHVDAMFEALIGDYSTLPRRYLLEHYLADEGGLEVDGIVWHEFMSADPLREVEWAQRLAETLPIPMAIVGLVDFLAPDLEARLERYAACANVTAVREHLGWDEGNPLRRFAKRGDLLSVARWQRGLGLLKGDRFKCSLEVFSSQLADMLPVIRKNPAIGFTVAVMGWPIAVDNQGFAQWKQSLWELSACENARITISAAEAVFGMHWQIAQVQPWVDTVFELFGTERVMFGSHRPISRLARNFPSPYIGYQEVTCGLSAAERDAVFRQNAAEWFFAGLLSKNS